MEDAGEFTGKVVIVTGGAGGIGAAAAKLFAEKGACIVVADVKDEEGEKFVHSLPEGHAIYVSADLGSAAGCKHTVEAAVSEFGGVDILFNNVGIQPLESNKSVVDLDEELWDKIINVNLKSRFLMAKYCVPEMRRRGGGVIIHNASTQGLQSEFHVPAYAASKGGDLSLMRQMSLDFAALNIRVLAVCPGAIDTPMLRHALRESGCDTDEKIEKEKETIGKIHPINRIGKPEDVHFAAFNEKATFMTGEHVVVDGGMMAKGAWCD